MSGHAHAVYVASKAAEGAAKSCDLWVRAIVLSMPLPNKLTVAEAFVLLWQDPETGDICDKKFDACVQSIPVAAMLVDLVLMGKLTPEFGSKNRMFSTEEQALVCTGDVSDSLHPATTFLQSLFLEAVLFFKMIIAFLIDTSVSMNYKAETGMTLLDIAKCGFENFVRVRQTTPDGKDDKYCLITTDPGPHALKVGPKESQSLIKNALKCLVAHSLTALGESLNMLFSVLNQGRLLSEEVSGIDRHGFGWYATNTEPAVIILLTDGGLPTSDRGVTDSLDIPPLNTAEKDIVDQPFHWDQRMFSYEIRAPLPVLDPLRQCGVAQPKVWLREQCQATGGEAHVALNLASLNHHMEQLAKNLGHGVVMNLTVELPLSVELHQLHKDKLHQKPVLMTPLIPNAPCHWPIPEDYHVDALLDKIPKRRPHPCITLRPYWDFNHAIPSFIVHDRYTLQPCTFTEELCQKLPISSWKAYVTPRAGNSAEQEPFGFVKVDGASAELWVLPYNYQKLIPLLASKTKSLLWKRDFGAFVQCVPIYYIAPLRRALTRHQLQDLIPAGIDTELNQVCTAVYLCVPLYIPVYNCVCPVYPLYPVPPISRIC